MLKDNEIEYELGELKSNCTPISHSIILVYFGTLWGIGIVYSFGSGFFNQLLTIIVPPYGMVLGIAWFMEMFK